MELLTVEDVVLQLKLCPDIIRDKANKGIISGAKIGKSWRFTQEGIDNFVQECRHTGTKRNQSATHNETATQTEEAAQ